MSYTYQSPFGGEYQIDIIKSTYSNGNIKIQMIDKSDGMSYATASVTVPGLKKDEVGIKDYSENEGVLDFLVKNNIVHPPHRHERSGFVIIPVCRLK